jgi:hypothetical protein
MGAADMPEPQAEPDDRPGLDRRVDDERVADADAEEAEATVPPADEGSEAEPATGLVAGTAAPASDEAPQPSEPDTADTGASGAIGEQLTDAETWIALASAQAAEDEAAQVDRSTEGKASPASDAGLTGEFGSEGAARDEERRSLNGAREMDMHRVVAAAGPSAAADDDDDDQLEHDTAASGVRHGHAHDHDDDSGHRRRRHIPAPAKAAGPLMMVVALGWLARQFLKRPKNSKK